MELRQGWEGNLPEDVTKTSQRQESSRREIETGELFESYLASVRKFFGNRVAVSREQILGLLERAETVENGKISRVGFIANGIGKGL